jgi:hypothetical protein
MTERSRQIESIEGEYDPRYQFVQLDPRPGAENPPYDFGIEITDPRLVRQGVVNLDHHGEGSTAEDPAACEQALTSPLPPERALIATVRPDMDSMTAMAVLRLRARGIAFDENLVHAVGLVDRYGPRVASDHPELSSARDTVVAIARVAVDASKPLEERVRFIEQCLQGTIDREEVQRLVAEREREYEEARKAAKVEEIIPGKLVFVESTHRLATSIGYEHAPVVIAYNPAMPILERQEDGSMWPSGKTYQKYTVCRWDSNVPVNLEAALKELKEREEGWGGRGDIFGSPQNQDTKLTKEEIIEVVRKYVS